MTPWVNTHGCTDRQYQDLHCLSLFGASLLRGQHWTCDRFVHMLGGNRGFGMKPMRDSVEEVLAARRGFCTPGNWCGTGTLIRDATACCSTPHSKIYLVLVEAHGVCLPEAHDFLRVNMRYLLKMSSTGAIKSPWPPLAFSGTTTWMCFARRSFWAII